MRKCAGFILVAMLILSGCSGRGSGPQGQQIRVRFTEVIHSVFYAPQYVAQAKGFFAAEGVKLDTSTAQGSDKGTAALLAGTADIALVGPETTIFIHNQDTPNRVKIFAQITARDGSFLMARSGSTDFHWQDVRGKSIVGWRIGSMPQMVAASVLREAGLEPNGDMQYISNLSAQAMAGAFQSGLGDYLQVYEPIASQLEQTDTAQVVSYLGEDYGPLPVTGYVATDRYLAENPEVVQRFTNAIYRAMLYIQETDPAVVAQEIASHFLGTDVTLLESAIRRYRDHSAWKTTPVMDPADFQRLQTLMVENGVLAPDAQAPFDEIGTNRFAQQAVETVTP